MVYGIFFGFPKFWEDLDTQLTDTLPAEPSVSHVCKPLELVKEDTPEPPAPVVVDDSLQAPSSVQRHLPSYL